jgi:hypothetical protein
MLELNLAVLSKMLPTYSVLWSKKNATGEHNYIWRRSGKKCVINDLLSKPALNPLFVCTSSYSTYQSPDNTVLFLMHSAFESVPLVWNPGCAN